MTHGVSRFAATAALVVVAALTACKPSENSNAGVQQQGAPAKLAPVGQRYVGPIIDMHMHATNVQMGDDGKPVPLPTHCFPGPCDGGPAAAKTEEDILRMTLAAMDKYHVVLGFLSGYDGTADSLSPNPARVDAWVRAARGRFLASNAVAGPGNPSIDFLRRRHAEGRLQGLGEILTQYKGLRPNQPEVAPYFALAAELDLPTHLHALGIGAPLPAFRPSAGNPLLLEDVLARHPKLRLVVENCGFPFSEEWIAVAYQYPQLYCEVSTATWIVNRTAFENHLRSLIDAGLSKRIMFGSDQMQWPETIGLAVDAINSLSFLTAEQKADIFYNNAARFLRLEEAEIAKHHTR